MLAYAANRPIVGARRQSPNAMLVVIAAHVAVVAVVMSAKMEITRHLIDPPIVVDLIKVPPPPPANPVRQPRQPTPQDPRLTQTPHIVPMPPTNSEIADSTPTTTPNFSDLFGPKTEPQPQLVPKPVPPKVAPRLITPASEIKPPYPPSKLINEEEAVLRLRLTISDNGRVVAVEPVGRADPAFLDAARRHLLAHWRFAPASEGGRAVASSTVITLHFQLDS
jgi:protein TonB